MQTHTYGRDTRKISPVHKNNYDQQPEKDTPKNETDSNKQMFLVVQTSTDRHTRKEFHSTHFIWREIKYCLKGPWLLMNHCGPWQGNPRLSSIIAIHNPKSFVATQ